MDLKSDTPFLLIKNGLMAVYPPLARDVACDVAVLGGGVTGALIAHNLVEAGIETVVLDRRDIGHGSTSVTTGLLQYEIDTHLIELIDLYGERDAMRAYQLCDAAVDTIGELTAVLNDDCGFRRRPSLYFANQASDAVKLQLECAARRRAGLDVRLLKADEIREDYSFDAPAAILSSHGGQVDAFRLAHRLFEADTQRGLRVFDRTTVTGWQFSDNATRLETDRECTVTAKHVIFATGFESTSYLKQKIASLKSTYALVSQAFPESLWRDDAIIWETSRPYLYLRRTEEGRIMLGGEDDDFRNPARRDARVHSKAARLASRFAKLFPHIPLEVEWAWAGTFGETKDGLAYIGPTPELPGALFAMSFGGNGITFGVVAADILRDAILGRPNDDARLFRFDR